VSVVPGHGFSSLPLLVPPLGDVTARPAAVARAAGGGGAGRSGGGVPGAAARRQRAAPGGGGGGVRQERRGPGGAAGRTGPGEAYVRYKTVIKIKKSEK